MRTSKLNHGLIPMGQQCPFVRECAMKDGCPAAETEGHYNDYSCGLARALDTSWRPRGSAIWDAMKEEAGK